MTYYFDCSVLFFCCFFCLFCIFFILFFVFFFFFFFFFFQAEDGIRDRTETGVQTCALPIFSCGSARAARSSRSAAAFHPPTAAARSARGGGPAGVGAVPGSPARRKSAAASGRARHSASRDRKSGV